MKVSPKLIIFDLDGTLIEFHRGYLFSETVKILEELAHPRVHEDELHHHFSSFDYFKFFAEEVREEMTEKFWSKFDWDGFPTPVPFPETLSVLSELRRRGHEVSIATSRYECPIKIRDVLIPIGVSEHITHIIPRTSDHTHWSDKREQIKEVCRLHNVEVSEAAMVGDIPPDITSAKDVGVGLTVAVTSGGIREEILRATNPDLLLPSIAHLLNHLKYTAR